MACCNEMDGLVYEGYVTGTPSGPVQPGTNVPRVTFAVMVKDKDKPLEAAQTRTTAITFCPFCGTRQ